MHLDNICNFLFTCDIKMQYQIWSPTILMIGIILILIVKKMALKRNLEEGQQKIKFGSKTTTD